MSSSLYPSLQTALGSFVEKTASDRSSQFTSNSGPDSLPQLPQAELTRSIAEIWKEVDSLGEGSSGSNRGELIRSVLDLVGREIVVGPIISGEVSEPTDGSSDIEKCQFQTLIQDLLDIVLTLYEVVYLTHPDTPSLEPGAIFIPLLEELVELISVETWRSLWTYVETRSKRFTKDMPASKGKALPLLRTINAFLRFLPRTPQDLVFRGRVHQFASSVISIADKSAINMRGDYGELKTTWEETEPVQEDIKADGTADQDNVTATGEGETKPEAGAEPDGDVKMDEDSKDASPEKEPALDFYSTLWSLQHYFSSPPSLAGTSITAQDGKTPIAPFDDFKQKSDFVLPKLFEQTQKEREMMGKEVDGAGAGLKRKRDDEDGGFFHPRYLTGKRLLEHELADPSFRRQILVQYFILFQFLLNLTPSSASKQAFTGGMPKDFVLDNEKESWVKSKIGSIREEMKKMPKDGARFEEIVLAIITRERHYAQWKNDACPEGIFEVLPLDSTTAEQAAKEWKKKVAPPPRWPFPVGSRSLSRLWNKGFNSLDQLKGWKRTTTIESLSSEIARIEAEEEDDKFMGIEADPEKIAENKDQKTKLNWQAIRLASKTDLRHFGALASGRNIKKLDQAKEEEEKRRLAMIARLANGKKEGPQVAKEESGSGDKLEDDGEGEGDESGAVHTGTPEVGEEAGADEVAVEMEEEKHEGEAEGQEEEEESKVEDINMGGEEREVTEEVEESVAQEGPNEVNEEEVPASAGVEAEAIEAAEPAQVTESADAPAEPVEDEKPVQDEGEAPIGDASENDEVVGPSAEEKRESEEKVDVDVQMS